MLGSFWKGSSCRPSFRGLSRRTVTSACQCFCMLLCTWWSIPLNCWFKDSSWLHLEPNPGHIYYMGGWQRKPLMFASDWYTECHDRHSSLRLHKGSMLSLALTRSATCVSEPGLMLWVSGFIHNGRLCLSAGVVRPFLSVSHCLDGSPPYLSVYLPHLLFFSPFVSVHYFGLCNFLFLKIY